MFNCNCSTVRERGLSVDIFHSGFNAGSGSALDTKHSKNGIFKGYSTIRTSTRFSTVQTLQQSREEVLDVTIGTFHLRLQSLRNDTTYDRIGNQHPRVILHQLQKLLGIHTLHRNRFSRADAKFAIDILDHHFDVLTDIKSAFCTKWHLTFFILICFLGRFHSVTNLSQQRSHCLHLFHDLFMRLSGNFQICLH